MRAATLPLANPLQDCAAHLRHRHGSLTAAYRGYTLERVFQPIYSFAHQGPVGCEALLRAQDESGAAVPPLLLFASARITRSASMAASCRPTCSRPACPPHPTRASSP